MGAIDSREDDSQYSIQIGYNLVIGETDHAETVSFNAPSAARFILLGTRSKMRVAIYLDYNLDAMAEEIDIVGSDLDLTTEVMPLTS